MRLHDIFFGTFEKIDWFIHYRGPVRLKNRCWLPIDLNLGILSPTLSCLLSLWVTAFSILPILMSGVEFFYHSFNLSYSLKWREKKSCQNASVWLRHYHVDELSTAPIFCEQILIWWQINGLFSNYILSWSKLLSLKIKGCIVYQWAHLNYPK